MKYFVLAFAFLLICINPVTGLAAPFAYVTNGEDDTVTIIDTATNTVVGPPITVGDAPFRIAANPAGTRVYVANMDDDTVSVIDTATNTVVATITVGNFPTDLVVNPAGTRLYVR